MILRSRSGQRIRRVISIRNLRRIILNIAQDCVEVYQIAKESPDDFPFSASAISAHWTPIVRHILASHLPEIEELEGLNHLVAFLDLDVEEFVQAFPEQVEEVIVACANYTPFEPYWGEMEPVLMACLHRIQVEEGEGEEVDEEKVNG